jgi:wobble nucleotide-excising tRNase
MLKRIQKLENIGRFVNASCGAVEFSRLTLIFGRNSYGKSTLSDVLRSLSVDDVRLLEHRKSIPSSSALQVARLSILPNGAANEVSVSASSSCWDFGGIDRPEIAVFDDTFFHENIFAARQFTRTTKENLSSFILGEQGVQRAQAIASKRKLKGEKTRERNQLQRDGFSGIDDLEAFLALQVSETKDQLEELLGRQRQQYDALQNQIRNITQIQERPTCRGLDISLSHKAHIAAINSSLKTSLDSHHEDAKEVVSAHIAQNFRETHGAEEWIRRGLQQTNGEICQFCGQSLQDQAKQLLELYRQYFDAFYIQHEESIRSKLEDELEDVKSHVVAPIKLKIQINLSTYLGYSELLDNENYAEARNLLPELSDQLNCALGEWEREHNRVVLQIEERIGLKLKAPHQPQPELDSELVVPETESVQRLSIQYNNLVNQLALQQQNCKDSSNRSIIEDGLRTLAASGANTKLRLQRLEKNERVQRMNSLNEEIQALAAEINVLEESLQSEQSEYLRRYFSSLNYWYHEFGSRDFSLELELDSAGHTPVYYLKVRFKGQHISETNLARIFSESDRRALALAVFWAHIENQDESEKQALVVVLDDPVTSFDNGRISSVHNEIISLYQSVRQVIVLSHFEADIAKFLVTYGRNHSIRLLGIENASGTSTLCCKDADEFIQSDHEKRRRQITAFADGLQNGHNAGDLRIFLETELTFRFARPLQEIGALESMLSEKIDQLRSHSFLSMGLAEQLHSWRERLNPSHHSWTIDDIEDQRRTATRFMNFVYTSLCPAT